MTGLTEKTRKRGGARGARRLDLSRSARVRPRRLSVGRARRPARALHRPGHLAGRVPDAPRRECRARLRRAHRRRPHPHGRQLRPRHRQVDARRLAGQLDHVDAPALAGLDYRQHVHAARDEDLGGDPDVDEAQPDVALVHGDGVASSITRASRSPGSARRSRARRRSPRPSPASRRPPRPASTSSTRRRPCPTSSGKSPKAAWRRASR
jgi:hypothetical protein